MPAHTLVDPSIRSVVDRLLGLKPSAASLIRRGGNNRIYRVETGTGPVALKGYDAADGDRRDRLGVEWAALDLISRHLPGCVPRPLARAPESRWAAYEWIEGSPIESPRFEDVDGAIGFVAALQELRGLPEAATMPLASEACTSLDELCRQVERRLDRLTGIPDLEEFLAGVRARFDTLRGSGPELPRVHQILSPSDFGFHNAIRRTDGRLVFIDFEYFGWDDPAKLASDIHWHPGMALGAADRERFKTGLAHIFRADPGYERRLAAYRPLIGLRWCLILLNEFLPEGIARRRHAGQAEDAAAARARQLAKARSLYSEVVEGL